MGNLRKKLFNYRSPSLSDNNLHQEDKQKTNKRQTDIATYLLNRPRGQLIEIQSKRRCCKLADTSEFKNEQTNKWEDVTTPSACLAGGKPGSR